MSSSSSPARSLVRFAQVVLAVNVVVVLWGAVVRATGSGAGCGRHWPRCNGEVLPALASAKTLIEFSHRLTSGVAFILVAVLLFRVLSAFGRGHPARRAAAMAMTFMVMEALAGAGLVWFELVADDRSAFRAVSMAVHLTITFLLLGSIALTGWWAAGNPPIRLRGERAWLALSACVVLLLIGISGAMTALGDTLFPKTEIGLELSASAHFLERLRVVHPILAVLGGGLVVLAGNRLARLSRDHVTARYASGLGFVYCLQLMVGAINLGLLAPLWTQLVHLAMADAVWLILVLTAASALADRSAAALPGPRSRAAVPDPAPR